MHGEKENLTLLYYPPEESDQEAVTIIELGPLTNACPQGLCKFLKIEKLLKMYYLKCV